MHIAFPLKLLQGGVCKILRCHVVGYTSKVTNFKRVSRCVSKIMKDRGTIGTDLLVIDNPVDSGIVNDFKKAGVKNIVCTVKDKDRFQKLQVELGDAVHVYKYDLLARFGKESKKANSAVLQENEIMEKAGTISGVVVLASGVSQIGRHDSYKYLVNRLSFMDTFDGFQRLKRSDWFLFIPAATKLSVNNQTMRMLNTFYNHKIYLKCIYDEAESIFYTNMEFKPQKGVNMSGNLKLMKRLSTMQKGHINLVHFTPKFDVLEQMSIQERDEYKKFIQQVSGAARLIPVLEKTFPGCGLELIELGYSMSTEIFEIPYEQFLQVFRDVKSLPGYTDSVLHFLCTGKDYEKELIIDHNPILHHKLR